MASTLPNINYGKHCMNLVLDIKKMSGQRKALIERLDIVNQRINYLRTIKKKKRRRDSRLSTWMRLGVTPTTPLLINGPLKMTKK